MATYIFSIIIPVYNTAPYLHECLDSVLQQAISAPIEVICINDGSTDDSLAILSEYTAHSISEQVHIRVISQPNAGLSAARNAGIALATGDYLLFLDSDDCLVPKALEWLTPWLTNGQTDIVAFNSIQWYSDDHNRKEENAPFNHIGQRTYPRGFDYLCDFVRQRGWGPSAACLYAYRRTLIVEHTLSFPVGMLHEDELFVPQALCIAGQTITLPMSLYLYRIRATSIAHTDNLRHAEDKQTIARRLYEYFCHNGYRNRCTDRVVYNLSLNAAIGMAANGQRISHGLLLRTAHTPKEYIKALAVGTKRYKR